jgi:hypothetical protein
MGVLPTTPTEEAASLMISLEEAAVLVMVVMVAAGYLEVALQQEAEHLEVVAATAVAAAPLLEAINLLVEPVDAEINSKICRTKNNTCNG